MSLEAVRERVARPGGKVYSARRPPGVIDLVSAADYGLCILVVRTHDVDLATVLAADRARELGEGHRLPSAQPGWFRLVPWDAFCLGVDSTWLDAEPGSKGAVPGVIFEEAQDERVVLMTRGLVTA